MSKGRECHIAAPLGVLFLTQSVFGQDSLSLEEADDARHAAYAIMRAAEEQYDCELAEHSMRDIGNQPGVLYLVQVSAEGEECREALIFASNMAGRDDKLIFRQIQQVDQDMHEPLFLDDQVLIHEVNPEIVRNRDPLK